MTAETLASYAVWAALAAAGIAALGEWLHARRVARVAALVFGPAARPRVWTRVAPALRVLALAGMAWAFVTLISYNQLSRARNQTGNINRHLLILLDVSPSMLLKDAGPAGDITRNERACAVIKSVLDRVTGDDVRFSAAGFYTEARMLVKECRDRELILHLAGGVPFHVTYEPGKTDLLKSLNQAAEFTKDWPRKSTTILVVSDGDSLPPAGLKPLPGSVGSLIVAGVGDTSRGSFIDGHNSRQDTANLSQLARRLGGAFYDTNTKHLPGAALKPLTSAAAGGGKWTADRRVVALAVIAAGAALLCLLPLLLDHFGSAWRPRAAAPPQPRPVV